MNKLDIINQRLANQQIIGTQFKKPEEIISWFGGIQAQDYAAAKWGIGVRLPGTTDYDIEKCISNKKIIRTWPMRGTLHIVSAEDIRWMMELMEPRIIASNKSRYLQLELNTHTFKKSDDVLYNILSGGKQLTRKEISASLNEVGIKTDTIKLSHILQRACLKQLICFGVKQGSEHTFTLMNEWVPKTKTMSREESLAELAKRYFISRGPASLQDYIWWSGLPVSDARSGLEMIKPFLKKENIEGEDYWFAKDIVKQKEIPNTTFLLPAFDEYFIAYKDRTICLDKVYHKQVMQSNGIFNPIIVIDGKIIGTWKRKLVKDSVNIELSTFTKLSKIEKLNIEKSANDYSSFLGIKLNHIK